MKRLFLVSIILPCFATHQYLPEAITSGKPIIETATPPSETNPFATIGDIPLPRGYERIGAPEHSFGMFLRKLPLKKNKTVYLFNGQPKINQDAQFAVINLSIGKKDLQQCADVVMRLRAEHLYENKKFEQIRFTDNANVVYKLNVQGNRNDFDKYLEKVFSHCGSLSLEAQLKKRPTMEGVDIGDVLVKGGSPGHAMLVVDVAINSEGKKIMLLVQGYMPAQDIHVVINPGSAKISPWYVVDNEAPIQTPEWIFQPTQLRHW
ncbi:MAG TPA: DUF4846 domain-containing protein [Chitinophagaceae bacterium]|nr:DUF4846 domain-containing protein [Chitinophagaceae bacterium]